MPQAIVASVVLCSLFAALSALHWYWAFGGKWAFVGTMPATDGVPLFEPSRRVTGLVACGLLIACLLCAWRGGLIEPRLPAWISRIGVWGLAGLFLWRAIGDFRWVGFFKRMGEPEFAWRDTWIYSPLCVLIAALSVWLNLVAP